MGSNKTRNWRLKGGKPDKREDFASCEYRALRVKDRAIELKEKLAILFGRQEQKINEKIEQKHPAIDYDGIKVQQSCQKPIDKVDLEKGKPQSIEKEIKLEIEAEIENFVRLALEDDDPQELSPKQPSKNNGKLWQYDKQNENYIDIWKYDPNHQTTWSEQLFTKNPQLLKNFDLWNATQVENKTDDKTKIQVESNSKQTIHNCRNTNFEATITKPTKEQLQKKQRYEVANKYRQQIIQNKSDLCIKPDMAMYKILHAVESTKNPSLDVILSIKYTALEGKSSPHLENLVHVAGVVMTSKCGTYAICPFCINYCPNEFLPKMIHCVARIDEVRGVKCGLCEQGVLKFLPVRECTPYLYIFEANRIEINQGQIFRVIDKKLEE